MSVTPVDVVICTNRASPFLDDTLRSVAAQTHSKWRVIVVDDGSPDPTAIERATARLPGITLLRTPPRGLPAARNAGIARGDAPLVALLDDDDLWEPDKLAAQVAALQEQPAAVASCTAGTYIDAEGLVFGGWAAPTATSVDFLSGRTPAPRIVTLTVRREAWAALGGFDESFSLAEDVDFVFRLAQLGEFASLEQALVRYRRHDRNMSQAGDVAGRLAVRRVLVEQREAARSRGDGMTALLLDGHLRGLHQVWARENVRGLLAAARQRRAAELRAEARWAARVAPVSSLRAAVTVRRGD